MIEAKQSRALYNDEQEEALRVIGSWSNIF